MTLSYDTARCLGAPAGPQLLHVREECVQCLRRTAPRAEVQWFMSPPEVFPCEARIVVEKAKL